MQLMASLREKQSPSHSYDLIIPYAIASQYKSAHTITVNQPLMHAMILTTMAQPNSDPCTVAGWEMMGPIPLALTMHQMNSMMPAVGATIALNVKRWRLVISQ